MRLQENNLIMEQYALINEKKKLPKGFVPFKKGHGKKKGKEDDKKDTKSKKKNPFASLKKESAAIYATMSEAPMTADDQQLQADAGIGRAKPSAEEFDRKALAHAAILDKAIDDALLLAAESWIEDSGSEENPRNIVDDIRTQCCASPEDLGWLIDTATTFASNAFGFPYDRSEMEIWVTDTTC